MCIFCCEIALICKGFTFGEKNPAIIFIHFIEKFLTSSEILKNQMKLRTFESQNLMSFFIFVY